MSSYADTPRSTLSVATGEPLTDQQRELQRIILSNPREWPTTTKEWIYDNVALNIGNLPITQILGYQRFVAAKSTTFPQNPVDDQPFIYPVDVANGIAWTFRYDIGVTDAYKYVFEGGAPLYATITTEESTAGGYTDLATVGPAVTIPLNGLYEVQYGACAQNTTADSDTRVTPSYGGSSPSNSEAIEMEGVVSGGTGNRIAQSRTLVVTVTDAPRTMKLQYMVASGTGSWRNRWLFVRPVRISSS